MSQPRTRPQVKRYPPDDGAFRDSVETSIGAVAGRAIEGEGILAAVTAMVRTTYPLATARVRFEKTSPDSSWDIFRDESVLDDEMLLRARAGDRLAMQELFDRHHALVYRVATRLTPQSQAAGGAVVAAFRKLVADRQVAWPPPRIRLAMASCDAAMNAIPGRVPSREDMARVVVELAYLDKLSATEIATVLQLDRRRVAALAIEGLRSRATA